MKRHVRVKLFSSKQARSHWGHSGSVPPNIFVPLQIALCPERFG